MRRFAILLLAFVATAAFVHAAVFDDDFSLDQQAAELGVDPALLISTMNGPIVGKRTNYANSTARAFLGIPYAAPPQGALRYQAPTPAASWTQPRDATQPGAGCQQVCTLPPHLCPPVMSEDCLYLNVYVPNVISSSTGLLPVMVFIHGGNFRQGSGYCGVYDGTVLVNTTEVILVTMNYRLGALGFFFSDVATANNGLLDQQQALIWVQNNIFNFGGDNSQITLFGQSAGATSVGAHLQNPTSSKLFQRAIVESVPIGIPIRMPNEAEALNSDYANALNCSETDLNCLQNSSIEEILNATRIAASNVGPDLLHLLEIAQAWQPTIKMNSFPIGQETSAYFQNYDGTQPLIIGTTSQEAYVFIYEADPDKPMSALAATAIEALVVGLKALPTLAENYPLNTTKGGDNRDPLSNLASDIIFVCGARNASAGIVESNPQSPIWTYVFDHVSADGQDGWGPNYQICWTHVCHASELPYVFSSAAAAGAYFTAEEQQLANSMMNYWTNFAKNSNPNIGLPVPTQWPQFGTSKSLLSLAASNITVLENYNGERCDFIDTLGYML